MANDNLISASAPTYFVGWHSVCVSTFFLKISGFSIIFDHFGKIGHKLATVLVWIILDV